MSLYACKHSIASTLHAELQGPHWFVDEEIDQSSYIKFSSNKLNLKNKNVLIDGEVPGVTFNNATNENGYLYIKEGSIPKEQYLFHLTFTIDGIKSNEITIYIVGKYLAATLYGPDWKVGEYLLTSSYIQLWSDTMPVNEQEVSISSDIPGVIFQPKTSNDGKLFLSTGSIPTTEGEYIISFTIGDIVSNDLSIYVYPNELRYNVTGTNWPGFIKGELQCTLNEDGTAYITTNDEYEAHDLFIPSVVWDRDVSYNLIKIRNNAFYNSELSGKLIIGNSIEIIEESAFYGCSELDQYLTLSNQLKEIGNYAFMNCAFGYTLNLPKTLIKIGAWAFNGPAFRFTRINSLYDMQPNFGSQSFGGWQNLVGPTRTVVNESETYTSQEFYDYLKTRGLDAGWQPSD